MLFGPIFTADVVASGRRTRYFVIRTAYALLILLVLGLAYESYSTGTTATIQSAAAQGAFFFGFFATIQLAAVLLMGPAFTAGSIATERERRTIEYLFATDLSNIEIVYGKFAASLLRMIALLLVALPILALTRLLGGISGDRMLAVFAITASSAVTVTALAIAISVWSPRARDAVIRTYVLLFGLLALPLIISLIANVFISMSSSSMSLWVQALAWLKSGMDAVSIGNPFVALYWIVLNDVPLARMSIDVWGAVRGLLLAQSLVTAACAVLAPWGVRRVHLRAGGAKPSRKQRRAAANAAREIVATPETEPVPVAPIPPTAAPRTIAPRARTRQVVYEDRPMLWKELFAERAQSRLGWIGRIVTGIALLAIVGVTVTSFAMFFVENDSSDAGPAFQYFIAVMASLVICGACLLLAARGATSITSEKERDTWTALLGTPLEAHEIISAKFLGTLHSARWALLLLGFLWLLGAIAWPQGVIGLPLMLGTALVLACFFAALGVAISLRSSNSTRALGVTLAVCVFLGGGFALFCGCFIALAGAGGDGWALILGIWPPYLSFAPHFVGVFLEEADFGSGDGELFILAYLGGTCAYAFAAFMALAVSIQSFDEINGRPTGLERVPMGHGAPRQASTPVVAALLAEEPAANSDESGAPVISETLDPPPNVESR